MSEDRRGQRRPGKEGNTAIIPFRKAPWLFQSAILPAVAAFSSLSTWPIAEQPPANSHRQIRVRLLVYPRQRRDLPHPAAGGQGPETIWRDRVRPTLWQP
jgi:hypothetical protein